MVSRIRWLVAAVAYCSVASAAPVPKPDEGKYEPPTITAHTQPGLKVLADGLAYIKLFGGDEAVKKVNESLVGVFGKESLPALDLTRPVCAYGYVRANPEESCGVLVIPTTSEKAVLAVIEKLGLTAKAEKEAGRYKLSPPDAGFPAPVYAQFADGGKLLYVSINAKPDVLDKDKLIPVAKLVDPKATNHLTITAYPERVPNEVRQMLFEAIDQNLIAELDRLEQRKPRDMPPSFPTFMKELLRLGKRTMGAIFTESDKLTLAGHLNAKTGNLELDLTVSPRAGTGFAKDIEAIKAPVGRFHQLTTKESVLGGWGILPTPVPKEIRTHGGAFLKEWIGIVKNDVPAELAGLFDAVGEQVGKAVSSGKVDAGFALTGPNKSGFYTAVAAVAFDDPAAIEKAARAAAKGVPAEFAKRIAFDALKVDGVAVHTLSTEKGDGPSILGPDVERVVGKEAKLHFAFGKGAVYFAVGLDAETELKRAMNLKPATATAFDIVVHGARGAKLLVPDRFNSPIIEIGKRLNDFVSYVAVDVTGGKELRVKGKSGALLMFFMFFSAAKGEFQAVPPPAAAPPPVQIKKQ